MAKIESVIALTSVIIFTCVQETQCFFPSISFYQGTRISGDHVRNEITQLPLYMSKEEQPSSRTQGDPLRAATGKRPSLHPVTINAISDAFLLRSRAQKRLIEFPDNLDEKTPNTNNQIKSALSKPNINLLQKTPKYDITPLDVAMAASKIATDALEKRRLATLRELEKNENDDCSMLLKNDECQVIAGRIVGVITRFQEMEQLLIQRVKNVGWVEKYGEYDSFGLLQEECATDLSGNTNCINENLVDKIQNDALFRLNRAECVLALFLLNVEVPKLQQLGEEVAGGSQVDFIDQDRLEVLQ